MISWDTTNTIAIDMDIFSKRKMLAVVVIFLSFEKNISIEVEECAWKLF